MRIKVQQNSLCEFMGIFPNTSISININSSCFTFSSKSHEVASSLIGVISLETIKKIGDGN